MEALLAPCIYPAFATLVCVGLFRSTKYTQHRGWKPEVRNLSLDWFVRRFAKANRDFQPRCVCPSVPPSTWNKTTPSARIFRENSYLRLLLKSVDTFRFWSKSDTNKKQFTVRPLFDIYSVGLCSEDITFSVRYELRHKRHWRSKHLALYEKKKSKKKNDHLVLYEIHRGNKMSPCLQRK